MTALRTLLTASLALAAACKNPRAGSPDAQPVAAAQSPAQGPAQRPAGVLAGAARDLMPARRVSDAGAAPASRPVPEAATAARIAAGSYHLGSAPGDPGRDPAVEADLVSVAAGAVDIDALPFPNDPAQPPVTGLSRTQAEAQCAQRGRRLCSELEWERACRGREERIFPGGDTWGGPLCTQGDLARCASSYGVHAMGTRFAEWTRDNLEDRAVIRGAGADANESLHRCASRRTAVPAAAGLEVGFRCCGGPAPEFTYPREVSRRPFREEPMSAAQLSTLISQVPELERWNLREGLAMFVPPAIPEVLNHGSTNVESHPELTFTVSAVRWSPTFGEELLVVSARSRVGSWIAALWPTADGRWRHAASFLLRDDPVSLILAFGAARTEVQWAACWNCGGESGAVTYTEDHRVSIVQR